MTTPKAGEQKPTPRQEAGEEEGGGRLPATGKVAGVGQQEIEEEKEEGWQRFALFFSKQIFLLLVLLVLLALLLLLCCCCCSALVLRVKIVLMPGQIYANCALFAYLKSEYTSTLPK